MDWCERLLHDKELKRARGNSVNKRIIGRYNDFIYRNYNIEPQKLVVNRSFFEKLLNEIKFLNDGYPSYLKIKTYMGMEIEIDDSVENFEIIGYRDFLGVREVVR